MIDQLLSFPTLVTLPEVWKRSSFVAIGSLWCDSYLNSPFDCQIRRISDLGSIYASVLEKKIDLLDRKIKVYPGILSDLVSTMIIATASLHMFVVAPLGCIWHAGNCVYYVTLCEENETNDAHLKQHILSFMQDLTYAVVACVFYYLLPKKLAKIWESIDNTSESYYTILWKNPFKALESYNMFQSLILLTWYLQQVSLFVNAPSQSTELKKCFGLVGEGGWLLVSDPAVDMPPTSIGTASVKTCPLTKYCTEILDQTAEGILHECSNAVKLLEVEIIENELQIFTRDPRQFLDCLDVLLNNDQLRVSCDPRELQKIADRIRFLFGQYKAMQVFLIRFAQFVFLTPFTINSLDCKKHFVYKKDINRPNFWKDFKNSLKEIQSSNLSTEGPTENFIAIKKRILLAADDAYAVLGTQWGATGGDINKAYKNTILWISPDKVDTAWKQEASRLYQVANLAKAYLDSLNAGH
jgi:hypothetical protein